MVYTFLRDFPETLKKQEFKDSLTARIKKDLAEQQLNESQKLQMLFFLDDHGNAKMSQEIGEAIEKLQDPKDTLRSIEVVPFQKRALQQVRKLRKDWQDVFLDLLFTAQQ